MVCHFVTAFFFPEREKSPQRRMKDSWQKDFGDYHRKANRNDGISLMK